jgi:hypothetical protein
MHNGVPNHVRDENVDVSEGWGQKPGHEKVQEQAMAIVAETC